MRDPALAARLRRRMRDYAAESIAWHDERAKEIGGWLAHLAIEPDAPGKAERVAQLEESYRFHVRGARRNRFEHYRTLGRLDSARAVARRRGAQLLSRAAIAGEAAPRESTGRRTVALAANGPPGRRPRPASGDDDPPHPDGVGLLRGVAA